MQIDFIIVLIGFVLLLNIALSGVVIFLERRDVGASWAWLLVLNFVPIFGFILYLLTGQNLTRYHLFQWKERRKLDSKEKIQSQLRLLESDETSLSTPIAYRFKDIIYMHLSQNEALLTEDNSVRMITDGHTKYDLLLQDIEQACDHVHVQYYTFRNDDLGKRVLHSLIAKALQGVKVRVLYDALGSRSLPTRFFRKLREVGGLVEVFFPSKFSLINLRLNYRNHRKIVVIDGKIGYTGGFNIGDEYLGLNKKLGYWRDTHLRIEGSSVHALQARFLLDWNEASGQHHMPYVPEHFPVFSGIGQTALQIVTSGPDCDIEHIKNGYLKMINCAKHSIHIVTPYFIPDTSVLDALRIACLSGIDVQILIPNKPDHMFVYWATLSHIGELLKLGARVYMYTGGFIHAKTIVVDEMVASIGTANIDVRSFRLNFEINAFIYDEEVACCLVDIFNADLLVSRELTLTEYNERGLNVRFKESISRLLSPIL